MVFVRVWRLSVRPFTDCCVCLRFRGWVGGWSVGLVVRLVCLWATDTTPLTWPGNDRAQSGSNAVPLDFPHACYRNQLEKSQARGPDEFLVPTLLVKNRPIDPVGA
jgi:hypothetical protein